MKSIGMVVMFFILLGCSGCVADYMYGPAFKAMKAKAGGLQPAVVEEKDIFQKQDKVSFEALVKKGKELGYYTTSYNNTIIMESNSSSGLNQRLTFNFSEETKEIVVSILLVGAGGKIDEAKNEAKTIIKKFK